VAVPDAPYIRSFGPGLPSGPVSDQPINVRAFVKAVRRRYRLIGALVLLGACLTGALALLSPPLPTARTLVILPATATTNTGAPARDMATQMLIATSFSVLAAAGESVSPPIAPAALKLQVDVSGLSEDVLQIQVSATTANDAKLLSNAVATDYIAYLARSGSASNGGVLTELQQQSAQLTKQILGLQSQINTVSTRLATEKASSPAGQQDAALLGSLRSEQEEVSLQLNNVNSQIVTAQLANSASASATQILQKAAIVTPSSLRVPELGVAGAAAGLLIGCLTALVRSRQDHRLRLRDELAGAIGVPVLASLDAWRCHSAKDWRRLVQHYQPSPVDIWNVRRVLQRLAPGGGDSRPEVAVVAFADDTPALAAGAQLARAGVDAGVQVTLVVGDHPSLALLRSACALGSSPGSTAKSFVFEPENVRPEYLGVRLTVSVIAVNSDKPELPALAATGILAVSSGFATAESLARVALAASDSGSPIEGIVVVNPESADSTTGSVAQVDKPRPPARRLPQRLGDFAVGRSR
jgi:capsular polysaccharide biosynthesis protein